MYDVIWFQDAQKDEALGLVKRLPEAEIARRELWPCHGLRFWLRVPIPDKDGNPTDQFGVYAMPNIYGSETLQPCKVIKFCALEVLPSGIVGGTFANGYLESPEFMKAAKQASDDEAVRLGAVNALRKKIVAEKLEASGPLILRWIRAVGVLAGVAKPADLEAVDAAELYEMLKLSARGLPTLKDYLAANGITCDPEGGESWYSEDPLEEARDAERRFRNPDKVSTIKAAS